jgi:hypothetical protein
MNNVSLRVLLAAERLLQMAREGVIVGVEDGYASDAVAVHRTGRALQDAGVSCKILGHGAYSAVLDVDPDGPWVLKVSLSDVDGYHEFVEHLPSLREDFQWAAEHLPHVIKLGREKHVHVYAVERLVNPNTDEFELLRSHGDSLATNSYLTISDELKRIARRIGLTSDFSTSWDWHNVMLRICPLTGEPTPVITDPWSHQEEDCDWCEEPEEEEEEEEDCDE